MSTHQVVMPKMGESITEATIIKWFKAVGDSIKVDETLLEIATDKVDSEIPSPFEGVVAEILFQEDEVVAVGSVIAIIKAKTDEGSSIDKTIVIEQPIDSDQANEKEGSDHLEIEEDIIAQKPAETIQNPNTHEKSQRFYSPLVRAMAKEEGLTFSELDTIKGSGNDNRVTKGDVLEYIKANQASSNAERPSRMSYPIRESIASNELKSKGSVQGEDEIIEMDRMRRLIADHMVMSKKTSAHVTSFIETDVTSIIQWRNKVKESYESSTGQKITFTPIFINAVAKAIKDFPRINVSVDGHQIILKKAINIGMATALPSGNLIVPVIHNADELNLSGLVKKVNDLANRARHNQLNPDEIRGGTFTLTNVGTFGNTMGTPIINQPQVAILSVGAIKKKPAVIETAEGDVIAIRHMMFLSLSYDHRVVDGMLGGSFLRRVADYMEGFDPYTKI